MSEEERLASLCDKICSRAAAVPITARKAFIRKEIGDAKASDAFRFALQNMMSVMENTVTEENHKWEKVAAFSFGVFFVLVLLCLAVAIPHPTPTQFFFFRVVLALAAAGCGGALTGFLHLRVGNVDKPWLQAGGGLAVFAVVYLINPAQYAIQ